MKASIQKTFHRICALVACCTALFIAVNVSGCKKSESLASLESDVNGFLCLDCKSKFCTDRKVFPTRCPDCKKQNIQEAVGYVCEADKQMTIEARNVRSVKCKQCAAPVNRIYMPQKVDLIAWGATLKTEADVTGQ